MKSEHISQELNQYEQEMASHRSNMDGLFLEIKDAMPSAAAAWINEEVINRIKANSGKAEELGIDRMRELKSKLQTLSDNMPKIVEEQFKNQDQWPHHVEDWDRRAIYGSQSSQTYLEIAFRNVISHLGSLLNEYGFLDFVGSYPTWQSQGPGQVRFSARLDLSGLPEAKVQDYGRLLQDYYSLGRKINDTKKSLSEAKAAELWDEA
jgi:hypothetical protein